MRAILVSLLLFTWLFVGEGGSVAATEINRIVLRVNDRIVTLHDFETRRAERVLQVQRADLPAEEKREMLADIGESILRQMYEELLLLSRADQLGIRASESEIEQNFRDTADSLGIENEEELAQALAASGLTEDALRAQIERGMVMQEVIGREVSPRVRLEEEEMRRYYRDNIDDFQSPERWKVDDAVVLASVDGDGSRAVEIATDIADRIATGELLADATQDYVELGKVTVIDLGWVARGDLEAQLEAALVELSAGEVSAPIEGRGGRHVLQVADYEEASPRAFAEVESEIGKILQEDRFGNEMKAYLEELAESSFVSTDAPPGAEGFELDLGREVLADVEMTRADSVVDGVVNDADLGGTDESGMAEPDDASDDASFDAPAEAAPEAAEQAAE